MNKLKKLRIAERKMDECWSKKVRQRDNYICQVCGCTYKQIQGIQAAHILPREFPETRWDLQNGIALCSLHHRWGKNSAHNNPIWFTEWLKERKPEQYNYLVNKMNQINQKEEDKKIKIELLSLASQNAFINVKTTPTAIIPHPTTV